jgi:hypothetical protein
MNQEKYFTDGFLFPFSGSRPIDSSTYRRAHPALQAVEASWPVRRLASLIKPRIVGSVVPANKATCAARLPTARQAVRVRVPLRGFRPSASQMAPGFPFGEARASTGKLQRCGHSTKAGAWFNSNSGAIALFSSEL